MCDEEDEEQISLEEIIAGGYIRDEILEDDYSENSNADSVCDDGWWL